MRADSGSRYPGAGDRDPHRSRCGVGLALIGFLLIGLLVMDWQTHTLPDAFTLSGHGNRLLPRLRAGDLSCRAASYDIHLNPKFSLRMSSPGSFQGQGDVFMTGPEHLVCGRLLAICAAAAIPWLIRALYKAVRKREGLGLGDVKLMAMIAAFLGFAPAMLALFVGVLLGGVLRRDPARSPQSDCEHRRFRSAHFSASAAWLQRCCLSRCCLVSRLVLMRQ